MNKVIIISLLWCISPSFCIAQKTHKQELSEMDVIAAGKLDGAAISVYGFYLGMTKREAKTVLLKNNKLTVDHNSWNILDRTFRDTGMFGTFIYDTDSLGQIKNDIIYLGWNEKDPGLEIITVFNTFADHAKGKTRDFFTSAVVNPDSEFYKKYLGKPGQSWPGSQFSTYFYPAKNLQVIENKYSSISRYYFMLTKKAMF